MNSAKAAAAASTPNIKGGIYFDSFDARVIEYQYAIWKLQLLITHTKALYIKVKSSPTIIPLLHTIDTLVVAVMGVNETLSKRLSSIVSLVPITDQRKVIPPVNTFPINFELDDTEATKANYSKEVDYKALLLQLLSILENAVHIYQKKLDQAIIERSANRISDGHGVPQLLELPILKELLNPTEILSLFKYIIETKQADNFLWVRAQIFVESIQKSTLELKKHIDKLHEYKIKPVDGSLKKLPDWQFTIHRIFAIAVRLSDLYTTLRKFGRELYIPSFNELHNPEILHNNVKLEVCLKNCDEHFKNNKKNQQLVYILAKAVHQGSLYPLKHNNVLEFINSVIPGYQLVFKTSEVLIELIKTWESVKREAVVTKLPTPVKTLKKGNNSGNQDTKRLEVIFNPEKEKLAQEALAKQQYEREQKALQERELKESQLKERQYIDELNNRRRFEERERQLRDGLKLESPTGHSPTNLSRNGSLRANTNINTRSRSGSNASVTSSSSNSSLLNSSKSDSLTGPKPIPKSSPNVSRSPSLQRRPVSVYMSSPAFDIRSELRRQERAKLANASSSSNSSTPNSSPQPGSATLPVTTRRRSSSLQSQTSSTARNSSYIAAAASAALSQERHSSLKSKTEVNHIRHAIQKQNSLEVRTEPQRSRSPSPLRSRSQQNTELPDINELVLNEGPDPISAPIHPEEQRPFSPKSILKNVKTLENGHVESTNSTLNTQHNSNPFFLRAPTKKTALPILSEVSPSSSKTNIPKPPPPPTKDSSPEIVVLSPVPTDEDSEVPFPEDSEPSTSTTATATSTNIEQNGNKALEPSTEDSPPPLPEKPTLKIIPPVSSLDPQGKTPEPINRESTQEPYTEDTRDTPPESLQTTTTESETDHSNPTTNPPKIVKKVRFTGVPDKIEDDPKPKKKGWIKPPRLMANAFNSNNNNNNNNNRSSLAFAADALQQESIAFHKIKRGEVTDVKTLRLGTLPTVNGGSKGKWKSLRDKFT